MKKGDNHSLSAHEKAQRCITRTQQIATPALTVAALGSQHLPSST